jgi:DNA-binding transcriptional LysR family regulator
MDWDHLRIFLAVVRHGQLLAAARQLGLNHATVARRLDAFESSLGTPLFDRRPTGCVPTQAGENLLPIAERIEFELLGVSDRLRQDEAEVSGNVRIGAPDGLGNYFLAAELGELTRRHPTLIVELVPLPRTFSLSRREADLAIALDRPRVGRLLVTKLIDYSLSLFASQSYLQKQGTPLSLEDLARHSVVTGVEDFTYATALDYYAILERHAKSRFRCASVVGQMEAVLSGTGIGVMHDFAARNAVGLVRVIPDISFKRSYFLLSHPDSVSVRRITVVRDFVIRRFREERSRFLADR